MASQVRNTNQRHSQHSSLFLVQGCSTQISEHYTTIDKVTERRIVTYTISMVHNLQNHRNNHNQTRIGRITYGIRINSIMNANYCKVHNWITLFSSHWNDYSLPVSNKRFVKWIFSHTKCQCCYICIRTLSQWISFHNCVCIGAILNEYALPNEYNSFNSMELLLSNNLYSLHLSQTLSFFFE